MALQIVYWTQGGNTLAMAEAIAKGVEEAGKEASVVFVSDASVEELKNEKVFALGCPAMGAEVLEESEMEPFVTGLEGFVSGKVIALFGSYGWGDGQWMRDWEDRCRADGAVLASESVIANSAPDDSALDDCKSLGVALA
jgi:flavodoxin short chain